MSLLETILQWLPPVVIGGASTYVLLKKFPLEKQGQEADTESKVLDNYARLSDRLTLYEDRMSTMRSQLNQATDMIAELNSASVRHSNKLAEANQAAADYKLRYEETKVGLDECRTSCQQQAAAIRKLEAVLTKHKLLTPEVEADIEATLNPQAEKPPEAPAPPPDKPFVPPGEPTT